MSPPSILRPRWASMAAAPLSGGGAAARFAVRDLRAYLRGRWRCERSLADRGVAARFDGVARFSDGAAGTGTTRLDYKEEGVVTMEGGGSSSATRAYTYTFPDGPAVAEVRSVPSARRGTCKQVCPGWCVRLRPCACLRPSAYVRVRSLAFVRTRVRGATRSASSRAAARARRERSRADSPASVRAGTLRGRTVLPPAGFAKRRVAGDAPMRRRRVRGRLRGTLRGHVDHDLEREGPQEGPNPAHALSTRE